MIRARILLVLVAASASGCGPSAAVREDAASPLPRYQRASDELATMSLVLIAMRDRRVTDAGGGPTVLEGLVLGKRLAREGGTPEELWKFKEAFVAAQAEVARLKPACEEHASKVLFVTSVRCDLRRLPEAPPRPEGAFDVGLTAIGVCIPRPSPATIPTL